MADATTGNPPHRRRFVATVVLASLLIIGGFGWNFWPRHDPRFIGRWIEREGQLSEAIWTFHPDGSLDVYTFSRRAGGVKATIPYRWFVYGNRFHHAEIAGPTGTPTSSPVTDLWRILRGQAVSIPVIIDEVSKERIVLRPKLPGPRDDAQAIQLRRLPDDG